MFCFRFQIMINGKQLIHMDRRNMVFSVVQDGYVSCFYYITRLLGYIKGKKNNDRHSLFSKCI